MVILVVAVARMGKHPQLTFLPYPLGNWPPMGQLPPNGKNKHHLLKYLSKNYVKKNPRMFIFRDPYTWPFIDAP